MLNPETDLNSIDYSAMPNDAGHFGIYGGRFAAETLMEAIEELGDAYTKLKDDPELLATIDHDLAFYVGRPSPLYHAKRWSRELGGAQIYLKREDLNHTGAHKINNTIGQVLLAKHMGKTRIIAETGAGQHGVATATICARLGLECVVYMGAVDIIRQAPNVFRMKLLGAEVRSVESGSKTLKDALNEAMRDWVTNVDNTFYCIGTVAGPDPYPKMVRDFQAVIGREAKHQCIEQTGRLPDTLMACVGGGSNAIGLFHDFLGDTTVDIFGVEAAGRGLNTLEHAAPLCQGKPGVLHGNRMYLMADVKDIGRAQYVGVTDDEAMAGFHALTRIEGIIPALESSHALAYAMQKAPEMSPDKTIIVCLSGRGDKDLNTVADLEGITL